MASSLEDGRLYTDDAIMAMGYAIQHGDGVYAVTPGTSWPRYELVVEKPGVYRMKGKMSKIETFDNWMALQENNVADSAVSRREASMSSGDAQRRETRIRLRALLAKGGRAKEGAASGGDGELDPNDPAGL